MPIFMPKFLVYLLKTRFSAGPASLKEFEVPIVERDLPLRIIKGETVQNKPSQFVAVARTSLLSWYRLLEQAFTIGGDC